MPGACSRGRPKQLLDNGWEPLTVDQLLTNSGLLAATMGAQPTVLKETWLELACPEGILDDSFEIATLLCRECADNKAWHSAKGVLCCIHRHAADVLADWNLLLAILAG